MSTATELSLPTPRRWPQPRAMLQLLKPITWFAPMWALACGMISGGGTVDRWHLLLGAVLLAGPLACGTSQIVNDWFDRHVDAVNQPERPIPSGRVPGAWGLGFAVVWTLFALAVAWALGPVVFWAGALGIVLAWAYSAPPLRLKKSGWAGVIAVGLSYETIPWFTGAAAVSDGWPDPWISSFALLYGIGAFGIMITNDFKAVEGDRVHGVRSLPVQLGIQRSARLACAVMVLPQLVVVGALLALDLPSYAAAVAVLVVLQAGLMVRLLGDPRARAAWYNATGTTIYVAGMMVCAFALRAATGGMS